MEITKSSTWSSYGSGSWFWIDHCASTVDIPEYGRDGRIQRAHKRDRPSGIDTVKRQETRNSWRDCSWHYAQSGNIHTCVQGRIHSRPQNGKGLLSQPRQDSNIGSCAHTPRRSPLRQAPYMVKMFLSTSFSLEVILLCETTYSLPENQLCQNSPVVSKNVLIMLKKTI